METKMEASHSKILKRSRRARDKIVLRKELPNILGFVGGILGDTEHAHGLLAGSKDIPDYLAKIADAAEPKSGTESVMSGAKFWDSFQTWLSSR